MANKKINQLVSKTAILSTDIFGIGDATTGQLFKKTIAELQAAIGGAVISVNGLVGTVVLNTDNIQETATPTNKYFTDARARGAISLTVTGASGASTYNNGTGVINVPTYTLAGLGGITAAFLSGTSGISYNSTTGVISFLGTVYTDASIRALLSGGTGITYNSSTGAISYSGTVYTDASIRALLSAGAGISYNSTTGAIASTITQYTDALARAAHSLTVTGSSGASTYNNGTGVINVPTYTLAGLGGQPLATNLTSLSGLSYVSASFVKMTAAGTFSLDTSVYLTSITSGNVTTALGFTPYNATNPNGYTNNVGTVTNVAALTLGTTGTDLSSSVATGTVTPVITLNVPNASASNRGALIAADWTTFNSKQGAVTLTTTGTSGAATFSSNTLNIPNYGSALSGYLPLSAGSSFPLTGQLFGTSATFSGMLTSTLGNNTQIFHSATATTGYQYWNMNNTSGQLIYGIEGSAGGSVIAGSSPYSTFIGSGAISSAPLYLITNGIIKLTIASSGAATFSNGIATNGYTASTSYAALFNGNVGIGTSTPSATLHIVKALGNDVIAIGESGNNTRFAIGQEASYTGNYINSANIDLKIQSYLASGTGGTIMFQTGTSGAGSLTERMRITSGGNVLIGSSTDNGEKLYVSGAIRATSTITANSDIRIKSNILKIENALEKVSQINGYTYNTNYDDNRHGGVIAQEIQKVFPEIVNTGNDGMMGVEYGNISALLIEAIKEQNIKIKNLENLLASK